MQSRILSVAIGVPIIALAAIPAATAVQGREPEFEKAALVFEVNQSDLDAEVVLQVKASEGLRRLELEGPDGQPVFFLDVEGAAQNAVGLQQFVVESGEPGIQEVLDTFPEGTYELEGTTLNGQEIEVNIELSHLLARAPIFTPAEGATVGAGGVIVQWAPVLGASEYLLEIEQDDLGFGLEVRVPAGVHSFEIPASFLLPDTEYDLGVATVSMNGNVAVAESSFMTQP